MALINNKNPKQAPIPVVTSRMQITNPDGTPTRSGLLLLEQLESINVFGPSGAAHSTGLVPDPGATAGTSRFLREDATWQIPGGGFSARVTNPATSTGDMLVQGPVQYSDLQVVMAQNIVYSASHPFTSSDVGNQLTITGGAGFAAGTYNMVQLVPAATGAPTSYMILNANVGAVGSSGGIGYTTTLTRLGVGTSGQVLSSNPSTSLNVQWTTHSVIAGTGLSGGGAITPSVTLSAVPMGASGPSHAAGIVPDPGATAGVTHYLREDATWGIPSGTGLTDPTTTLGDLIVRGSSATTRLGVGTNAQVLTADSTQTLGVKWATPASAPVSSVFGRTGAVVAATGDYTASQITGCQTPWLSNIDGGGFALSNASQVSITTSASIWSLYISASNNTTAQAAIISSNAAGAGGLAVQNDAGHIGYLIMEGSAVAGGWADTLVLETSSAQPLVLATNGLERMRIISTGNIGIGNTVATLPDAFSATRILLLVGSATASNPGGLDLVSNWGAATAGEVGVINFANYGIAGTEKRAAAINSNLDGAANSGNLVFWTASAGTVAERMRITSAGNAGIGNTAATLPDTSSGSRILLLVGSATANNPGGLDLVANLGAATTGEVGVINFGNYGVAGTEKRSAAIQSALDGATNSGNLNFFTASAGVLAFRMRINNAGQVGIGTNAPVRDLHIAHTAAGATGATIMLDNNGGGTGSSTQISFSDLSVPAQPQMVQITALNDGNFSSHLLFSTKIPGAGANGVSERMRLTSAGNLGLGVTGPTHLLELSTDSAAKPTTNTWTIFSDGRLKRNVQAFTEGLETLLRFRPVSYEYNGEAGMPQGTPGVGLIAQEAQEVYPPSIRKVRKEIAGEQTDVLCTNTSDLAYMVINALRELDRRLKLLEAN